MTFFTGLGIFVVALLLYIFMFGIGYAISYNMIDDNGVLAGLFVGIIISILFATFICNPEDYGYQEITVSENVMEVAE